MEISRIPDAAIIVDRDGSIVQANRLAEKLLGYERGKLLGLPVEALVPDDIAQKHVDLREAYSAHPVTRPIGMGRELRAMHADGRVFPAEIAIGPAEDGIHIIAVIRDITSIVETRSALERALSEVGRLTDQLQAESEYLREEVESAHGFTEIVGNSKALTATLRKIELVAKTNASVLLLGETGTGKELLAGAIHSLSERRDRPLVKVDCGTLPAGLIESELFGHEKGAFTGAYESKTGRFEVADTGTIFLDEIGELPLDLQSKLLRVLEDGIFRRLGSKNEQKVDVRIIAATNRDLKEEMRGGRFRTDLYYRLGVFPVVSPPLRARREDIPLLVSFFASKSAAALGRKINSIDRASMDALTAYDWPGNIRELRNVIERAVILSQGGVLEIKESFGPVEALVPAPAGPLKQSLQAIERARILRVLEESGWKIKGTGNAAGRLGLSPSSLRTRMKKLGITRPSPAD